MSPKRVILGALLNLIKVVEQETKLKRVMLGLIFIRRILESEFEHDSLWLLLVVVSDKTMATLQRMACTQHINLAFSTTFQSDC